MVTENIYFRQQYDFLLNDFIMWLILIQKNTYCLWIETEKYREYKFYDNIGELAIRFFDIIAMTPREALGLYCGHFAQLNIDTAIYTLLFTLQSCYKPLGIPQMVTKSQKLHISSHDGLQKFHNINFG